MIGASPLVEALPDSNNVALTNIMLVESFADGAREKPKVADGNSNVDNHLRAGNFHVANLVPDRNFDRRIRLKSRAKHFLHLTGRSASPEKRAVLSITCINNLTQVGVPQRVLAGVNDFWALAA